MKITVRMSSHEKITKRILNDEVGKFLAETWGKIFQKYTPMDSGLLSQRYDTEPYKVIYTQTYSHYQWQGIGKSGRPLNYSKEQNFLAQSHWEEAAERDRKNEVAKAVTDYLRRK